MVTPGQYLETKYAFIDSEAFRKARFDWTGRVLSKLVEFAKLGYLRLLVTDVTVGEIKSLLRELLADAATAVRKYDGILKQIAGEESLAAVADTERAVSILDDAFEKFLKETRAINVPLSADLHSLLANYFGRRPPFSLKKKSEFPDAIVIASLMAWCEQRGVTAYVVSGDPDLKACCSALGPLLYAGSVADIVSQANVSREFKQVLETALGDNEQLKDQLAEQIKTRAVVVERGSFYGALGGSSATIERVVDIHILSADVLEREGNTLTCEVEFEAGLVIDLSVELDGVYGHELPSINYLHPTVYQFFYAEVITEFDQSSRSFIDFDSIHVHGNSIELRLDEVADSFRKLPRYS